jgi:hypothetical protein
MINYKTNDDLPGGFKNYLRRSAMTKRGRLSHQSERSGIFLVQTVSATLKLRFIRNPEMGKFGGC